MRKQHDSSYQHIAKAIIYIQDHFREQPSLNMIAAEVGLSPSHLQRLFTEWAGISPKKFTHYLSLQYAKSVLATDASSLLQTALATGLSGTSRLHDLFIHLEGMTPGQYKNGGENLNIKFSFSDTPFGFILIASTAQGICHMAFHNDKDNALVDLKSSFPNATYQHETNQLQQNALEIFTCDWQQLNTIKLHLKASPFQLKVWQALLCIPMGARLSYSALAKQIDQPKAARAVANAVASNGIAFLIPCHRVIQQSGISGGYRWDPIRKSAMLAWEAAKMQPE